MAAEIRTEVESFLHTLDHPWKTEIIELRQIILDSDPGITEGIKWKAPSFRTTEYFATFQLRMKEGVQIILHRGAKVRPDTIEVADPECLLTWLAKDRASVQFRDLKEIADKKAAFKELLRIWISCI